MKTKVTQIFLFIFFIIILLEFAAIAQNKEERKFQGSNSTRVIISSNSLYLSTSDNDLLSGIWNIDTSGVKKHQQINLPISIPVGEAVKFRVKDKYFYVISTFILGGGPQRSFSIERYSLTELVQQEDGSLGVPTTTSSDTDQLLLKRNVIGIPPLEIALSRSYGILKFNFDFTINSDQSITLYILRGNTLEIWKHSGLIKTTWKQQAEFQIGWSEEFSIFEIDSQTTLLTGSGEIFNLNGKVLSKITEQKVKLANPEDKDKDDPIFIENQDSGEYWIVTTKKNADGTITLSKSRSLKAGKIEDVSLPNNIAAALNTALKVKAKDTSKK